MELMVAMTIGLLISLALSILFANTSANRMELERNNRQVENGRYAMQMLEQEITHAGYYGRQGVLSTPTVIPDPCSTVLAVVKQGMPIPIQGYAGANASPLDCLTNYKVNTDVIVLRRADTVPTLKANLDAKKYYIQANIMESPILELGNDSAKFILKNRDGTDADIREYHQSIYYIGTCSDCGANDGIPTLKRVDLTLDATKRTVNVVDAIENMQVEYGVDTDSIPSPCPQVIPPVVTGYGAPDSYTPVPPVSAAVWGNVMSLKVHLLARNNEATLGHDDSSKTYKLGSYDVPTSELDKHYKRNVFSAAARAVNQSQRREGLRCQ